MIYANMYSFTRIVWRNPKVLLLLETKEIPMEQCKVKITTSMFSISGSGKV